MHTHTRTHMAPTWLAGLAREAQPSDLALHTCPWAVRPASGHPTDCLRREVWSAHQVGHKGGKPARMSLLSLAGAPPLTPPSPLLPTNQGETDRH